jgi:hypothetical protein
VTTLNPPMKSRIAILTMLLVLAAAAPAAAQGGGAFGPLPPAQPTPTPTPERASTSDDGGTDPTILFTVGGLLILGFGVMGWYIMRDARKAAPTPEFAGARLREEGPHRHKRQANAKARAKTRAQKSARKAHRRR